MRRDARRAGSMDRVIVRWPIASEEETHTTAARGGKKRTPRTHGRQHHPCRVARRRRGGVRWHRRRRRRGVRRCHHSPATASVVSWRAALWRRNTSTTTQKRVKCPYKTDATQNIHRPLNTRHTELFPCGFPEGGCVASANTQTTATAIELPHLTPRVPKADPVV